MAQQAIEVYIETGEKRTFAGAIAWPGWCRSARSEDEALQALVMYGPRYAHIVSRSRLGFQAPDDVAEFKVVERHTGSATTDFGATDVTLTSDTEPLDDTATARFQTILRACWRAFDRTAEAAGGKELRKGPRGGGRDIDKIVQHVLDVEIAYLKQVGVKFKADDDDDTTATFEHLHTAVSDALAAAARDELPTTGPRGGKLWTPRYFVRRYAWHIVDHIWEIEDRVE